MRKITLSFIGLLLVSVAAWAGDPWKGKDYKTWDEKDVKQILSDSPWAKKVLISLGGGPASVPGGPPSQSPAAGAGSYSSSGSGGGTGGGGIGGGQANSVDVAGSKMMNEANFTVRWFAALTMRRAIARDNILRHAMTEEQVQQALSAPVDDYIVLLVGNGMFAFQGMDEAALQKNTYLRSKKTKEKFVPTKVDIQKKADGKSIDILVFHFAKKSANGEPVVANDEKGMEFVCEPKSFTIRTTFEPAKMVTQDGPDI